MTKLILMKALFNKSEVLKRADDSEKIEQFRKQILDYLDSIDDGKEEEAMQKAFSSMLRIEKGGKGLAIGTVREWKGKKFKKIAPGKWRPVYDSETRGAKMAVSAIKRKIAAAPDAHAMMRIILENRDRFSDKYGQPLPFVQELSRYVAEQADVRDAEKTKPKKERNFYEPGKPKRGQAAAARRKKRDETTDDRKREAKKKDGGDYKEWEQSGKDAFKDGKPREPPYDEIVKPGYKIRSFESKEAGKKTEAWLRGWDRALISSDYQRSLIKENFENGSITAEDALRVLTDKNFAGFMPKAEAKEFLRKKSEQRHEPEEGGIFDQGTSDFEKIQDKYKSAKAVTGEEDEIQVGKELISGKWKLVEADTPTASHDETNFYKTPGFPTTGDGATINDRDYGHDKEAQEIVMEIGADYDGRAVSVDNPVIVTKDGIVISGNNRTMSSKIAARKGTDKGYIEALKRKAKKFGFTAGQIDKFKHPRVIFETAENTGYSTDQFAKFNKSSKKAMSPIESAVKVSKTIKAETVEGIAGKMADFETLGELYADRNVVNDIFNTLQRDNIISAMDRPQYVVDGGITGAGKEFLETVLIGSVINESNIRGLNREGCKSIRQKLVRAITPLIENKGMDGYSISKELNEAVDITMQVAVQKDKFKSIDDYSIQKNLFGIEDDPVAVAIARKLEGTQKEFAAFMQAMNGGLKYAANGEADIFIGGVESREDILARMLNIKKAISNVIDFFRNLRAGKGPRFIKKAVPIRGGNGETELSERWMRESIEGVVKPWTKKSLTWSGYPLQGRTKIHGMDISIENKKGSTRSGTDKDGHDWSIKMNYDYGYIRGTVGKDKDHVDCYIGPKAEAETVFIVHQNDPTTGTYDEDKVMLGFDSEAEAKAAYLKQYDHPGFLGDIDAMDIETFKDKAFDENNKGKRIEKALFTENELRNNARFAREVCKFFKDEEGNLNLHKTNRLAELPGFPEGLDLENCELLRIDPDKIYFTGGGDWQQMIKFAVELKNGKLQITHKFEDVGDQDAEQIKRMKAAIEFAGGKMLA